MSTARVIALAACVCIAGYVGCNRRVQHSPAPKKQPASAAVTTDSASAPAVTNEQPTLVAKTKKVDASELMDPRNDGWDSEAFADAAKKQLSKIFAHADHLTNPSDHVGDTEDRANGQASEARNVVPGSGWQPKLRAGQPEVSPSTAEAWTGLLHPEAQVISPIESLQEIFNDGHVFVFRPDATNTKSLSLAETVEQLASSLSSRGTVRRAWKVIGVNVEAARPETTCLYEGFAVSDAGRVQQTAQLTCVWQVTGGKLKLTDLRIEDFEQVSLPGGAAWFADETPRVLSQDPCYEPQLQRGGNHWLQRIERAHGMDDSARNGLAIGDANGDGLDDVYLCQPPGLPNRLFLQQDDGTFADHAAKSGVDFLDQTSSALFVDFDNDGDQDLAVGSTGAVLIMSNDGSGVFSTAATLAPQLTDVQSLTAADFDLDGDVDLFICVYRDESGKQRGEFVFHNAVDGGRNFLFRNEITENTKDTVWQFRDVTAAMGLAADASRYTLAAAWEDYDNDGDPDLYLANDYGRNILYRNDRSRFVDVTASTGLNDTGFGMSVDWGDFNRDGTPDLYVGNMFSSAGSRITNQPGFQKQATAEQRMVYRRMAQGNSLFSGGDHGAFEDVSNVAQVQMGRWAWSSCFADLNNDGWEDLVVANGYITAESTGDL